MFEKLRAAMGMGAGHGAPPPTGAPPAGTAAHPLYPLLFCDDPGAYRAAGRAEGDLGAVLAAETDVATLERIAAEAEESRIRLLAYRRLAAAGHAVPKKLLLGTVVEVALDEGLDVLAAYADGRVRFLHHRGGVRVFEACPLEVAATASQLLAVSVGLVEVLGPWDRARLPPPKTGHLRVSFLVSDGLYFGEGGIETMHGDPKGGPVVAAATRLLQAILALPPVG